MVYIGSAIFADVLESFVMNSFFLSYINIFCSLSAWFCSVSESILKCLTIVLIAFCQLCRFLQQLTHIYRRIPTFYLNNFAHHHQLCCTDGQEDELKGYTAKKINNFNIQIYTHWISVCFFSLNE